jgi:hypothetical protein
MSAGPERFERVALGVVAALTVLGFALAVYDARLFRVYTREDGAIENGTVVALLAGAAVCFGRVARLHGRRPRLFLAATALLGVLYVAAAGEELSWGQHLFKFAAPEFFQQYNAQREANLHNIVVQGVKLNRLIFGTGLLVAVVAYCSVVPLVYRRSPAIRRLVDALAIPLPRTRHVVCYAVLAGAGALIPSQYRWEVVELISATVFLVIAIDPVNRAIFDD